jgi:hypothetical protein
MNESTKLKLSVAWMVVFAGMWTTVCVFVPQVLAITLGVLTGALTAKAFFTIKDYSDCRAGDKAIAELRNRRNW